MTFLFLAAQKVVILATFSAAIAENVIKIMSYPFQCSGFTEQVL